MNTIDNFTRRIKSTLNLFKRKSIIAFKKFLKLFIPVLIVSSIFIAMLYMANVRIHELETQLTLALQEPEDTAITNIHIEEKLTQIGELSTSSFEYTNIKKVSNTRQVFGVDIPGTTNTLEITYSGVIKVGYNIDDIQYNINNDQKTITFTLPQPEVLDNYIIQDSLICKDGNNILNPISSEDVNSYFKEIEQEELIIAENNGIYDEAEDKLKSIIQNFFAAFPDYKIIFV